MATITMKGTDVHTVGELPSVGAAAPDFRLTKSDLTDVSLSDFKGKKKIISIVPSLATRVCATSAKRFNSEISGRGDTFVLNVSCDLPFAQQSFCESNKIDSVTTLSQLRNRQFGSDYGVTLSDGPFEGLLARAVLVVDENDRIVHSQLVPEISDEPDYAAALAALD